MTVTTNDSHFRQFALSLERAIQKYGDLSERTLLDRQRRQVEALVGLEKEFRKTLIRHRYGPLVYKRFVKHIVEEKRNILAARPFFRERQQVFTSQISKALQDRSDKTLYKFHGNYQFIMFAMAQYKWDPRCRLVKIAEDIGRLRTELVEMNLPLAISRARIFWSRTPKSHLSYMDLVQISCEGLISAVDKFCLPFSRVFRAVMIGRSVGNLIENYSQTEIHFYPPDKRKIYRANKIMRKYGNGIGQVIDFEKMAKEINKDLNLPHPTNEYEIASLISAASCVSADSPGIGVMGSDYDSDSSPVNRFAAPESVRPDVQVENHDLLVCLEQAIRQLSIMDQKLLRLKGVEL